MSKNLENSPEPHASRTPRAVPTMLRLPSEAVRERSPSTAHICILRHTCISVGWKMERETGVRERRKRVNGRGRE